MADSSGPSTGPLTAACLSRPLNHRGKWNFLLGTSEFEHVPRSVLCQYSINGGRYPISYCVLRIWSIVGYSLGIRTMLWCRAETAFSSPRGDPHRRPPLWKVRVGGCGRKYGGEVGGCTPYGSIAVLRSCCTVLLYCCMAVCRYKYSTCTASRV